MEGIVLKSAAELFFFFDGSLNNCSQLSMKKPFLDLVKIFCKVIGLVRWCSFLENYRQTLS